MSGFNCTASHCQMVGAISVSGSSDGFCAYHHGAQPKDWPRITQVLADWQCVATEANRARRALLEVSIPADSLPKAWERLAPMVDAGWKLEPLPNESYGSWGRRLEHFLFARTRDDGAHGQLPPVLGSRDWDGP